MHANVHVLGLDVILTKILSDVAVKKMAKSMDGICNICDSWLAGTISGRERGAASFFPLKKRSRRHHVVKFKYSRIQMRNILCTYTASCI